MRRLAVLFIPLFVAGCALPPAISLASFAADGVSYIATGKSTTDHALSALAQEDCAMLRALNERAICVPDRKAPIHLVATKPPVKGPAQPSGADVAARSSAMEGPALVPVEKEFGAGPNTDGPLQVAPVHPSQLIEKNDLMAPISTEKHFRATPAKTSADQFGRKGYLTAPTWSEIDLGATAARAGPDQFLKKDYLIAPTWSESNLRATAATLRPVPSPKNGYPATPIWAAISKSVGRVVLSHCMSGRGLQPAAQCTLGPDA